MTVPRVAAVASRLLMGATLACACSAESSGPGHPGNANLVSVGSPCTSADQCAQTVDGVAADVGCSAQDICAPYCNWDSDCSESHVCLDDGTCAVSTSCDQLSDEGCPTGEHCALYAGSAAPRWATECAPEGRAGSIWLYVPYQGAQGPSGYNVESEPLCQLGAARCPQGTTCLPLDGPQLGPVNGVRYGMCRVTCDVGGASTCPSGKACMWETNAGRPPVATCGPVADYGCSDGMGGTVDCGPNLPVGPACFNPYSMSLYPSCASSSDCPSTATCQGGSCVAIPLACDPFQVPSSCGAGQTCLVQADGMGSGTLACAPSGGGSWPATCGSDADCGPDEGARTTEIHRTASASLGAT